MLKAIRVAAAASAMLAMGGCAVNGGWMGAEKEAAYEKDLAVKRLAEVKNNDDYYEIHKDGRIYVLSDAKAYQTWLKTDEIPLVVTQIGAGPKGETLKMALTKNDSKAMESKVGYKGAAQQMFEGTLEGMDKNFFGLVQPEDGTYYVFDNWKTLNAFRKGGNGSGYSEPGPNGAKVIYVGASARPAETAERFAKLFN